MKLLDSYEDGYGQESTPEAISTPCQAVAGKTVKPVLILQLH